MTVLVVEDEPLMSEMISRVLEIGGYDSIPACDGYRAMELAEVLEPDLITLDLGMPGLNGQQILRKLDANARLRYIPVVILTANDDGLELTPQVREVLHKPNGVTRLLSTVTSMLSAAEPRPALAAIG